MGDVESSELIIEVVDGMTTMLRVAGDLDIDSSPALRTAVDRIVSQSRGLLVFDFSAVDFLDSSGLAVLIGAQNAGADVRVCHPSPAARLAITACGLEHFLGVE